MRIRVHASVIFVLMILLLAGCGTVGPGTPSPSLRAAVEEVEPPPTPRRPLPPYDLEEGPLPWSLDLREACKSYMDVDLRHAFDRFGGPIFWTFHTSFYDPPAPSEEGSLPNYGPGHRLGCLRYYWRSEDENSFTGTLDSAVIIVCTKSDSGGLYTEKFTSTIPSSNNLRDASSHRLPHRQTTFSGGAYLTCPLDITASLLTMVLTPGFREDLSYLTTEEQDAVVAEIVRMAENPTQSYGEFMMAAALENGSGWASQPNPILFYGLDRDVSAAREIVLPTDEDSYQLGFSLLPQSRTPPLFGTMLAKTEFLSLSSHDVFMEIDVDKRAIDVERCFAEPDQLYLWVDFGQCDKPMEDECDTVPTRPSYLRFLNRTPGMPEVHSCRIVQLEEFPVEEFPEVDISEVNIPADVPFWIGPGLVYIGYNPSSRESVTDGLIFYEIWLDPDSAVTPSG